MITFIIPTIKRDTLNRSINSLLKQYNPNWKAIVAYDGVSKDEYQDPRIVSISIPKIGVNNHAGLVRNAAMKLVESDWIGFLDDDDTLSYDYVEKFYEEIKLNPKSKCIIFRMKSKFEVEQVLPAANHKNFIKNKVGISFAFKKDINVEFEPSTVEDFNFLDKIRNLGHKMIISPYVTYFVREQPSAMPTYQRVEIN